MTHLQNQMKLLSINFHKTPFNTYCFNWQTAKHEKDNNANLCNVSLQMYQEENNNNKEILIK